MSLNLLVNQEELKRYLDEYGGKSFSIDAFLQVILLFTVS